MSQILNSNESEYLRREIISQCTWSETYSSLKHILKRTAYQLPLLISFVNINDDEKAANENYQTILFFDRNLSNKLLFTPLKQRDEQPDQFDVYPKHCTFVMTDSFKGLFEIVRNGQRCGRIYTNLEQLSAFLSKSTGSTVFMSRDSVLGYFQDTNALDWSSKEYPQGAIFRGECIHRSNGWTEDGREIANDFLECRDEDGYTVFLKLHRPGRYSIIATSIDQQENQPEIYLHSTQTPNIDQLIKRLTSNNGNKKKNNCIRLVRGPVPDNFFCQYFYFMRQQTHDILVGLTQEGLVIEWNLDSHVPCRYATNLNDMLDNIHGTALAQTLESYIDQARTHHRENFQQSMQLLSTQDWAAFFQYWRWTGDHRDKHKNGNHVPSQSRHRFQLIASIQDLSDHPRSLASAFKRYHNPFYNSSTIKEHNHKGHKKSFTAKQRAFLSQMSKLILSPTNSTQHGSDRLTRQTSRASGVIMPNGVRPFDDSIYDSNQNHQFAARQTTANTRRV